MNQEEIEQKNYAECKYLETEKQLIKIKPEQLKSGRLWYNNVIDIKQLTESYEKVFSESERKYLWRMFLTYSSDNVIITI
jgi:hypothetical protein